MTDIACVPFNDYAFSQLKSHSIHTVFLVARWALYAESWPKIGIDSRNKPVFLKDADSAEKSLAENKPAFQRSFFRTLNALHDSGIRVYIVEAIPEALADIPNGMATNSILNRPSSSLAPRREFVEARQSWVNAQFRGASDKSLATIIPTHARLCDDTLCKVEVDDILLYRDNDHLSVPGSLYLQPIFDPIFGALAQEKTSAAKQ